MAVERPKYDGFIPGQHVIEAYGAGGFVFAGMSHKGSILALPGGISAWRIEGFDSLTIGDFNPVFLEPAGAIDILLVGTGDHLRPVPKDIRAALLAHSIRVDPMATTHAVSTYNILLGEKRKVAAALIATM